MFDFSFFTPMLSVLYFLIFVAGLIDSIAGGGGLVSLPAYMITGMPVHVAYGCNKFSAACGTTFSTFRFFKKGSIDLYFGAIAAVSSFIGSAMAANIALMLDEKVLKTILIIVIPIVAIIILFNNKSYGSENLSEETYPTKKFIMAMFIGLLIGFYDGLIGPGTGTFAIIAFSVLMKYDLRNASGNAKLLNLASNYASLVTFIFAGTVNYSIAIPAAFCGILGNYIGAGLALKKGAKLIQPMLIVVLTLLLVKMLSDVFW